MASQVAGFEYDIFISYRHNDNRSGWVTEFVKSLKEELAATIKDPVSVYFDSNPYDGLLETHHVSKSLEGKLRSLILIPILSQTYCDTKSFAWNHEFCAFNSQAQTDSLGRDIRLQNGNVTSRILPVIIHDLDGTDRSVLEKEIGAVLRGIELIYKEPGVNRPLRPIDSRNDNQHRTDYRNQVNKLTNAIKEILASIHSPHVHVAPTPEVTEPSPRQVGVSIAVLPFLNISQDNSEEYLADGLTENIIAELSALKDIRIISRTSVMRFRKSPKSALEIAAELGVKYLIEGSIQIHREKIRVSVQLIDASDDKQLWSKVFFEKLDDIFEIQNRVGEAVKSELAASIASRSGHVNATPTKNPKAYDFFLKGRHAFNQWNVDGYITATGYFESALKEDPDFRDAYSYLASTYSSRMSWNGDLSPKEAMAQITPNLEEAWKRGASDNDFVTRGFVEFFFAKNFAKALQYLIEAERINPNNALAIYSQCYVYAMMGRIDDGITALSRAKLIEPLSIASFNYAAILYYLRKDLSGADAVLREGLRLFPSVIRFHDFLARVYVTAGDYQNAIDCIERGFQFSGKRPPSMVAYLALAFARKGEHEVALKLYYELKTRSDANEKGVNYYLMHAALAVQDKKAAARWLLQSRITNDVDLVWLNVDPLLAPFRAEYPTTADYARAEETILKRLEQELPARPYHNVGHVRDVLEASVRIGAAEEIHSDEMSLLRIAALMHDAGFIKASKDHEVLGTELAKEWLPEFGFTPTQIDQVVGMIMATRIPQSPTTQLERILCDADLDYLGRDDFPPIAARLYEEMKDSGAVESQREWNLIQRTFLQSHRYHTPYNQQLRESQKQTWLAWVADNLKK